MTSASEDVVRILNGIYSVSRETIAKLERYRELLIQWQRKTNLIAPSTLDAYWTRHVADSMQLLAIAGNKQKWTDIGSGGGFPGLVIAIVKDEENARLNGDIQVDLVESIQKKCAFLRRVAIETEIKVGIHCTRIESATKQLDQAEIITARALAALPRLLELTGQHLVGERRGLFHKGRDFRSELADCHGIWEFDLVVHQSIIDAESVVLEISNVVRV